MSLLHHTMTALADWAATLPLDPIPNPEPKTPPGNIGTKITDVMGWSKWVALAVCVVAIFIAGARMAMGQRRGEGGEHASAVAWVLAGVIIISGGWAIISFLVS